MEDAEIGIEGYATKFEGIRGRVRASSKDFVVEEVIDRKLLGSIEQEFAGQKFAVFELSKEGIDSIHAAKIASKPLRAKVRILGLKDSRAYTRQYSAVRSRKPFAKSFSMNNIMLKLLGYTSENFSLRALLGNNFKIWIRGISTSKEQARKALEMLKTSFEERRLANFYGHQRFGGTRPITHLVGRAIVKGDFRNAVRILVSRESPNDNEDVAEARKTFLSGKLKESLQGFDDGYDLERALIQSLIERPEHYVAAIRELPLRIRRLFLAAYSSYIFNKVLSRAISNGESFTAQKGDVASSISSDYRLLPPSIFSDSICNSNMITLVPTAGFGYYPRNGRFDTIMLRVMREEDILSKMFYVKEAQEMSLKTGLRSAVLLGNDLTFRIEDNVLLEFFLVKGSYATTLLREIMKSDASY